jgi:Asp-tRNA(Asn)/Glu-tRNA(Gln) amidotransferase B subunit
MQRLPLTQFLHVKIIFILIYPKVIKLANLELPIVGKGFLDIDLDGVSKRIGITRAHRRRCRKVIA